jgi:hypothetical protein
MATDGTIQHLRAEQLRGGDEVRRGAEWWRIDTVKAETPTISAPFVRLRCTDQRGEIREFTLPSDLTIVAARG